MKHLMSGNEAIARGIYEAGIKVASAYPGTPSTEILENAVEYKDDVYCEWAPNEKVALEVAYGASIAGSRSICTMKLVGVNVAADPMFTSAYNGVTGGFIIVSADDPGFHSSQNEQDNRNYARHAKIAMVEPADSQECKDFVKYACEISEMFDTPVLFRTTTRINHSKSLVEFGEREERQAPGYVKNARKFVCVPANARGNHYKVEKRQTELAKWGETCPLNKIEMNGTKIGVVSAGVSYQYAKEVFPEDTSFLKLGLTYPLPIELIRDFASKVDKLYVIEELDPFMENEIRAAGIECIGKELTGLCEELNPQLVGERVLGKEFPRKKASVEPVGRPPALCPGCPHRGFFYTLAGKKDVIVSGDIGCYGLGSSAPLECIDCVVCMGGSFTMGHGMSKSFMMEGVKDKKIFAVLGDSTFFHNGMPGAAEIIFNKGKLVPVILDNSITAMTGHQDNPSTGFTLQGDITYSVKIEAVMQALGYEEIIIVDPQDLAAMNKACDDAIDFLEKGVAVCIITRRPCVLLKRAKIEKALCKVDTDKCKSCRRCLKVGCPAVAFRDGKAYIDSNQCVGCTVCAQACPFGAIEKEVR
ncbi:MAG: indolepyruvate ferredoxin oxidoreductase subunit alpha [Firmicutes bacterium]|nr:indolepyruvate ferredoxin oxidoreductase subunit alpha [Bacillota bacterium]